MSLNIAAFITPHGFGHAARAMAMLEALGRLQPLRARLYTTVPERFFAETLGQGFSFSPCASDVGLVQVSALREDLAATRTRLDAFLPFDQALVDGLAADLLAQDCRLVLCDVAPLGIAVARRAGIPSLLVENFTWDWIYAGYLDAAPWLQAHIDYLREVFAAADFHVRAEPLACPGPADLVVGPVSRAMREPRDLVRERLEIEAGRSAVLVTMGGWGGVEGLGPALAQRPDLVFLLPVATADYQVRGNLRLLPGHGGFYHPDLMAAADAVVGKVGYSTVAEAYHAATPFGYVGRPAFRESSSLCAFVAEEMHGVEIGVDELDSGAWLDRVDSLLERGSFAPRRTQGAEEAAGFIMELLDEH